MPAPRRVHPIVKALIVLVLLTGLGIAFMRSLDQSRAEPYTVRPAHLEGWAVAADAGATGEQAALRLQPPPELPLRLFRQVFTRAGESLSTPVTPGIPLVLASELDGGLVSTDELTAAAREAGLDQVRPAPRCMGYRRESQPGAVRQVYFLVFDLPGFDAVRRSVSALHESRGGNAFEVQALSPVMLLAAQPDFARWMPIVATSGDCVAPVVLEE